MLLPSSMKHLRQPRKKAQSQISTLSQGRALHVGQYAVRLPAHEIHFCFSVVKDIGVENFNPKKVFILLIREARLMRRAWLHLETAGRFAYHMAVREFRSLHHSRKFHRTGNVSAVMV